MLPISPSLSPWFIHGQGPRTPFSAVRAYPVGLKIKAPEGFPRSTVINRPVWQCIIGGIVSAFLSFIVVLFSLRGITRVIAWIVAGFKAEDPGNV